MDEFAEVLRQTVAQMRVLVAEKDQLLAEKGVLAEELQHRVRNNLQLVNGMLTEQLRRTADEPGKTGLRGILRRITTLSKVYDQLLGVGLSRTLDFSEYARLLCGGLPELQGSAGERVRLTCTITPMTLDLGATTVRLDVSIGITGILPGDRVAEVMQRADRNMYVAKHEG